MSVAWRPHVSHLLRRILKQCLQPAQDVMSGEQKVFLADAKYILMFSFWPFKSKDIAYTAVLKFNPSNKTVLIYKKSNIEYFDS